MGEIKVGVKCDFNPPDVGIKLWLEREVLPMIFEPQFAAMGMIGVIGVASLQMIFDEPQFAVVGVIGVIIVAFTLQELFK